MARIRALTREEAPPESRPAYDLNLEQYGQVLNSTGIYAYRPSIQLAARGLGEGIAASGLIPRQLRHLINVRVASLVGCPY